VHDALTWVSRLEYPLLAHYILRRNMLSPKLATDDLACIDLRSGTGDSSLEVGALYAVA